MRSVLARTESDFRMEMRALDARLETMIRDFTPLSPQHRSWARDVLDAASQALRSGDRRALDSALRSPPAGLDPRLSGQVSAAANAALAAPATAPQREAVAQTLDKVANELFSGHLPGQGPPAGMLQRYRNAVPKRVQ